MQTDLETIKAIRSQTLSQLQEVRGGLKPTYWIDGQRVHWEQYADALQRTIDWCDQKLIDYDPYEVVSQGAA